MGNTGKRLEGRIALVTGASRGIGASAAVALGRAGAHVVLLARTVGGMEEVDDKIRAEGGAATIIPQDLRKLDDLDRLGPALAEKFGRLDILVGNAGMLGALSPVAQSESKMWEQVFTVNVMANYRLIRTLDPLLRGGDAGRAIFVTSGAAQMSMPFWGAYSASKAALESMVRAYAAEVENTSDLRVNILDPGVLRTAMRAMAFPGEDPESLPHPETIAERFVELAAPDCTAHGETVKAAS